MNFVVRKNLSCVKPFTFYDINPLLHILIRKTVMDTAEIFLPAFWYDGSVQENVLKVENLCWLYHHFFTLEKRLLLFLVTNVNPLSSGCFVTRIVKIYLVVLEKFLRMPSIYFHCYISMLRLIWKQLLVQEKTWKNWNYTYPNWFP